LEFAAAELSSCLHTSIGSARALMADGLDLRHRLPQLWQHILTGAVPVWKARKVAQATRHLSKDSAMQVDAAVAGCIATLPWGRLETLLAAKIIEADPKAAEEQARIWEAERFVRAGRTGQAGLKLLIAKANAGDVIWFMATLNRIAEILRLQGDLDSAEVRRSKAIGILAQPALALQLLWDFRGEQHPGAAPQQPEEPIHNQPKAPYDHSTTPPDEQPPDAGPQDSPPGGEQEPGSGEEPEPADHGEEPEAESNGCDKAQPPHHDDPETTGHGLIIRPTGVDLGKLRPKVVLHIHLSQEALWAYGCGKPGLVGGVARFEGVGPLTLNQVRRFLTDTSCQITVQPVIDPQDVPPVDGYEIPRRIREAMFLRMPASCFPYATKTQRMDLDHTKPYIPLARGGPPRQTGVHNLKRPRFCAAFIRAASRA
jgi:hypothetical protein